MHVGYFVWPSRLIDASLAVIIKRGRTAFISEYFSAFQTHSGSACEHAAKNLLKMAGSQWVVPSFK